MTPITYVTQLKPTGIPVALFLHLRNLEDFPIGIALLFRYYIKMGDHVL